MSEIIYLSQDGLAKLKAELVNLKEVKRVEIAAKLNGLDISPSLVNGRSVADDGLTLDNVNSGTLTTGYISTNIPVTDVFTIAIGGDVFDRDGGLWRKETCSIGYMTMEITPGEYMGVYDSDSLANVNLEIGDYYWRTSE